MVKKLYVLLPFLMILILLGGQLPELLSLIDDTSNDFVEESLAATPASVTGTTANVVPHRSAVLEEECYNIVLVKPSKQSVASFPPDVLRLLSIQRK